MSPHTIQDCTESDIPYLLEMLQAPGGHGLSDPSGTAKSLLENRVLVYHQQGRGGFAFIEPGANISQIIVYVDPKQRGRGIGGQLWQAALAVVQPLNPATLWAFYRQDAFPGAAQPEPDPCTPRAFYARRGLQVWYAYHLMQYSGPAFPEAGLAWRSYEDRDFELYFPAYQAAFSALIQQLGHPQPDPDTMRRQLQEGSQSNYLCFDGERFVGSVQIAASRLLDDVFVCPELQGQGYGRRLVHFAANRILEQGIQPELCVVTTNHAAEQLYRRVGFQYAKTLEMSRKSGCEPAS